MSRAKTNQQPLSGPAGRLIAGLHAVRTALKHGGGAVSELWLDARRRDGRMRELLQLAREQQVRVHRVAVEALEALVTGVNHQGVVALSRVPVALDEQALKQRLKTLQMPGLLLVLDGVQDPHNLGACLRSADAAGVQAVIAPRDRAAGLTPTACKVASGAADTIPFYQVTNLARTLRWLRGQAGFWLVGLAGEAPASLFQTDLTGPVALVLGGEGQGLRRLTREQCDFMARLPMLGQVESLNVSVAAGIALYEALRQRAGEAVE